MTAGVYIITNTKNGTGYIGSTVDLRRRWASHKSRLRHSSHVNPHLQSAWNLYGEETFEFGILEYLGDPEELHLAEQFWMDIYREEGKELYNFGLAARHPMLGRAHTGESKRRNSEAHTGRRATKETCRRMSEAARGRRHSEEARRKIGNAFRGKPLSEEHKCKLGRVHARPYPAFVHRETGEVIPAGVNLKALCRERGLHSGHMCKVKAGTHLSHKGWALLTQEENDGKKV